MHTHAATLVAAVAKRPRNDLDVVLATHAIIGMVLVFVTARETALRRTKWTDLNANRIQQIESLIAALANGALDQLATMNRRVRASQV